MQGAEAIALERAKDGDAEAFRTLVEQCSHHLFGLAFRMTGNEQDAEDVVQETFLRAHRQLGRFESRARLDTWLHRIAANQAIDLLRRRKRRRTASLDAVEAREPLTSHAPGPDRSLLGTEAQQRLAREMEALSERERVAFTLRHHEGLSIKEISRVMNMRENATKNTIFRAVRKLRRGLEPLLRGRAAPEKAALDETASGRQEEGAP